MLFTSLGLSMQYPKHKTGGMNDTMTMKATIRDELEGSMT